MHYNEFNQIVSNRIDHCQKVLTSKGQEYSRYGDRLWNFKAAGRKQDCSQADALMGMKVKHDVSIDDMVDDINCGTIPDQAMVAEKIGDAINYLLLLEAVIEEARISAEKELPQERKAIASLDMGGDYL